MDLEAPRTGHLCEGWECEKEATHRCAGCKKAWYCSAKCQKDDWMSHIFDCKPGASIRTAHHLARACRRDLMPTDAQTLEDYGFNRVDNAEDMSMLLGLYQGLFLIHKYELEARTLDKWLKDGTLVEHIKETFEPVPPANRGGYYPWFLENQWVLDGSPIPSESTPEAQFDRMERKLWAFLGPTRKAQFSTWSRERKSCAHHYSILLSDLHPAPFNPPEQYIGLGYCVAREMYTEMAIARLYTILIRRCSFEEYCDAFESASMVALMQSKGVFTDRTALPRHFEHVMSARGVNESVWDLKQYLYGEGMIGLIPSVRCDYGFANCKLPADSEALAAVYKIAFDHTDFDEMELHAHCINGQVLEYVEKFHKLSKKKRDKFRRLMKNPYPLPDLDSLSLVVRPSPGSSR